MRKIENFESFAVGFFLGLGQKKPTAEDITRHSVENLDFAAALVFYMSTDISVIAKRTLEEKQAQVAQNIGDLIKSLE